MDAFSFIFLLIIWGMISSSIYLLLRNNEEFVGKRKLFFLVVLVVIGLLLPLYAKVGLSDSFAFTSSDEYGLFQNYLEYIKLEDISFLSHASGPGTILFFYLMDLFTKLEIWNLIFFVGLINSAIIPLLIFFLFKKISGSNRLSFGGALCALSSSYLIWPVIEVRPQQIGLILILLILIQLIDYFTEKKTKNLIVTSLLILSLSVIHTLTFLYLLPLIWILPLYFFLTEKNGRLNPLLYVSPLFVWIIGLILNNSFVYVIHDIRWGLKESILSGFPSIFLEIIELPFGLKIFFPLLLISIVALIAFYLVTFILKKKIDLVVQYYFNLSDLIKLHFRKSVVIAVAFSILLITIYTFTELHHVFLWYGTLGKFIFLESGNLFIGFFGVLGFLIFFKKRVSGKNFLSILIFLTLSCIFAILLATGFFTIYMYANFGMRTLNYLIIFLGFFSFIALSWIYKMEKLKYVAFIVLLLFPCSLIVGTRDPTILNMKVIYHAPQQLTEEIGIEKWKKENRVSIKESYRKADSLEVMLLNQKYDIIYSGKARFVMKENGGEK